MRQHNGMRPQDIVILFKLISSWYQPDTNGNQVRADDKVVTAKYISVALKISPAEVSHSMRRSQFAGLLIGQGATQEVALLTLYELLVYGVRPIFPVKPGHVARGVPTAHSAPPLNAVIRSAANDQYVWPHTAGTVRGQAIEPLFRTVPEVVGQDERLYQMLALTDALRVGRSREVLIARQELKKLLYLTS